MTGRGPAAPIPAPGERVSSPRGRGILLATVLGSGMAFLDSTVVNVALPALQDELKADLSALQWTADGYLLTLTALMLIGGALGDRYGRRVIYALGLVLFALSSAGCGIAPSAALLIAARVVQGVGAALLVPGSLAIIRDAFREEDQGRAIGLWAGLSGVTTALGPLLGGWLIGAVGWRSIFFLNVPLGAVALWASLHFIPGRGSARANQPLDVPGALLAALGLGGVVYALIEGPAHGWTPFTTAAGIAGLLALLVFLWVEAVRSHPMLPLGMFRVLQFSGVQGTTLAVYFALNGALFLLVLELQRALGYSPFEAGAALTPITVLLLVLSPVAGKVGDRIGRRPLMSVGPLLVAGGMALLTWAQPGRSWLTGVLPGVGVLGLGLGITVAPLTSAVFDASEQRLAGVASGINNAVARLAGLLAVALLPWAARIAGASEARGGPGFVAGFQRAMWICAGLSVVGAVVAFLTVERRSPRPGSSP